MFCDRSQAAVGEGNERVRFVASSGVAEGLGQCFLPAAVNTDATAANADKHGIPAFEPGARVEEAARNLIAHQQMHVSFLTRKTSTVECASSRTAA
jgi:hypothetical protein